jgi:hypothetical protein
MTSIRANGAWLAELDLTYYTPTATPPSFAAAATTYSHHDEIITTT